MACIVNTSKKDIKYKASNMLKIIIDLGYNINKATPKYGHTALMKASSICDVPSLEIILKSNVNINQVDKNFNACAWMHALESEYGLGSTYTRDETFKVVKLLIDAGAGLMMTSTNQKDFPTFVTKCKQLNKSEKDKLRAIFIRVKGAKEATEHRKICRNKTVGAIDIIPEEYIAKYHGLTDFLLMPKNVVVHEILCLFCRFGIKEFYVKDVLNIINRTVKKWNDYKPTFTVTTVEDQLDYFVDFSKQMNLSKNPDLSYRIVMIEEKLSTESNILQMTKMFKELFEDKDE
jgi:hypothetical protein